MGGIDGGQGGRCRVGDVIHVSDVVVHVGCGCECDIGDRAGCEICREELFKRETRCVRFPQWSWGCGVPVGRTVASGSHNPLDGSDRRVGVWVRSRA